MWFIIHYIFHFPQNGKLVQIAEGTTCDAHISNCRMSLLKLCQENKINTYNYKLFL